MVQFCMIEKINNKWQKGDKYRIIFVLNKNNKALGMNFVEGGVKCFGKGLISLLDWLELYREKISNGMQ